MTMLTRHHLIGLWQGERLATLTPLDVHWHQKKIQSERRLLSSQRPEAQAQNQVRTQLQSERRLLSSEQPEAETQN